MSEPSASGTSPPPTAAARAAGRPAGHAAEIVRIARRAVVDVLAGEVVGVFAHVERADQNGAGRFEPLDQRARRAVAGGSVAVDLRAGAASAGRRHRTGSSPRTARRPAARASRRGRAWRRRASARSKRALLGDGGEGVEHRVALANAGKRSLNDAERGAAAGRDRSGDIGSRTEIKIGRRHVKHDTSLRPKGRKHGRSSAGSASSGSGNSSTSAAWRRIELQIERLTLASQVAIGASAPSACALAA